LISVEEARALLAARKISQTKRFDRNSHHSWCSDYLLTGGLLFAIASAKHGRVSPQICFRNCVGQISDMAVRSHRPLQQLNGKREQLQQQASAIDESLTWILEKPRSSGWHWSRLLHRGPTRQKICCCVSVWSR